MEKEQFDGEMNIGQAMSQAKENKPMHMTIVGVSGLMFGWCDWRKAWVHECPVKGTTNFRIDDEEMAERLKNAAADWLIGVYSEAPSISWVKDDCKWAEYQIVKVTVAEFIEKQGA